MTNHENRIEVTNLDENDLPNVSRRTFFKRTAIAGAATMAVGGAAVASSKSSLEGRPTSDIETAPEFKPKDQRDVVLTHCVSASLNKKHPERSAEYSRLHKKDFHFKQSADVWTHRDHWDNSRPGYTQADKSLFHAGWEPLTVAKSTASAFGQPNTPLCTWDQSDVEPEQFEFGSAERAATMIKSAAKCFGAIRCGIARNDKRWNYDPIFDIMNDQELSWEKDFPFEPKSVIVLLVPMDYDNTATSPAWTSEGGASDGYSAMGKVACQMSKFLRGMGYKSVAAGNDLANSVAYGIMAGLGEGGRNAQLIAPGIGPRMRICKVFTELDLGEAYDTPHTWGIREFCESCKKCAEACPAQAHSHDDEPSFYPTYEFSGEPGYTWNNHVGVKKWHSDAKKCWNFWSDNDASCANCIAACTFNEPDFWHHWFIMAINPAMPKFVHSWMAEAHPAFGYGGQGNEPLPGKVEKFWESGKGMRTNTSMKNNIGNTGQA